MLRKPCKSAKLVQILAFYDEPQLALFETDNKLRLLAIAVGENSGHENKFFCVEVIDRSFRAYKNGKIDLYFLFKLSVGRKYYTFNWSKMSNDGTVEIRSASGSDIQNDSFYPERGFFEEDHTEEWATNVGPSARTRFGIDGRWDASDFSKLYNRIGDSYSFLSILHDLNTDELGEEEREEISNAITKPNLDSGGSYKGFYNNITSKAQAIRPLRISGVEYHSLGHIEIEGRKSVFDALRASISAIEQNREDAKRHYHFIYKILQSDELLTDIKGKKFSSEKNKDDALIKTKELASILKIEHYSGLLKETKDDHVIFIKKILSFYRRIEALNNFTLEGRVNFEGELARSAPL
ncbi:hypothetical protein GCM10007301_44880 [Azorhizobium oxalatiphilum]|uniref:ApeA N-terminal domain-containing protein n=1 Tax=Azorhizobium oxalatiphilum TaxID=980631 RepID=A0A917FH50_9HYPH|nr:hypothetical protein [Azorhizobium oxalatiphilum]GGF79807.1 hypothetical protein GCM10007301_44880 [Azorhizobium oxalatiphilum]